MTIVSQTLVPSLDGIEDAAVDERLARRDDALRLHGVPEMLLIFSFLLLIEWAVPGPASLAGISPHPLWLPVVLLSAQYGSFTGLVAAILAAFVGWLAGWPPQTPSEDFYAFSMRVWRDPALWMLCAIIVGGLRNRQIKERFALEDQLRAMEEQRNVIGGHCSELQAHIARLERAAAMADDRSVDAALDAIRALRASRGVGVHPALAKAVSCWLADVSFTVYRPDDQLTLRRLDERGALAGPAAAKVALAFEALRIEPRPFVALNEEDAGVLEGVGVMLTPVGNGSPAGIIVVERVDLSRLNEAGLAALGVIADALGAVWSAEAGAAQRRMRLVSSNKPLRELRTSWPLQGLRRGNG